MRIRLLAVAGVLALLVVTQTPAAPGPAAHQITLGTAGSQAAAALVHVYYAGDGKWRACNAAGCPTGDVDWGYDSLTYTLALRAADTGDQDLVGMLEQLTKSARVYPAPCVHVARCRWWSDTPEWDAIALADEYQATHDPSALTKAEKAFAYVASSREFALGACPGVPYQQPGGGRTHVKTLETEANAVKAALLLYHDTGDGEYLTYAIAAYNAARSYFLDARLPLYSVYVFDSGHRCTQLPRRFFASVNGDMIWSGAQLYADTGQQSYLDEATQTANAVRSDLSDGRGIFADLQAENDVAEPLVEGMNALAARGVAVAHDWLLSNAAAALSARTADGSFGRFFDGPPPATTVTAWQTNGGLALEIAASAIAPTVVVRSTRAWAGAKFVRHPISALPRTLRFDGSGIAVLGTLGEHRGGLGHARVLVDGRETVDGTGIWQNKSSSLRRIPDTILFVWRWPRAGPHKLTFLPGLANAKEGGSFLDLIGYDLLGRS